jgi:hypothetical protein
MRATASGNQAAPWLTVDVARVFSRLSSMPPRPSDWSLAGRRAHPPRWPAFALLIGLAASIAVPAQAEARVAPTGAFTLERLDGRAGCLTASEPDFADLRRCRRSPDRTGAIQGQISQVTVAPDGRDVYLASFTGLVGVLRRDPATGRLREAGCVAPPQLPPPPGQSPPCLDPGLPNEPSGDTAVYVSPDSRFLYIIWHDETRDRPVLTWFRRDVASGALSYAGCLSGDGTRGRCARAEILDGSFGSLRFSPDGTLAYVLANPRSLHETEAIVALGRDPHDGALSVRACATASRAHGACARLAHSEGRFGGGEAVSRDGRRIIVGGSRGLIAARMAADGRLIGAGCWRERPGRTSCRRLRGPSGWIFDLAASPDGRRLYAASFWSSRSVVAAFAWTSHGRLSLLDCRDNRGRSPCRRAPALGANGGTLAAFGHDVVLAGSNGFGVGGDVTLLHLTPRGRLVTAGCVASERRPGCPRVSQLHQELEAAAAAPDGSSVYVTSIEYSGLVVLGRGVGFGRRSTWHEADRSLRIRLSCPAPRRAGCRGMIRARLGAAAHALIASSSYRLRPGGSRRTSLAVPAGMLRALRRHPLLELTATDAGGLVRAAHGSVVVDGISSTPAGHASS